MENRFISKKVALSEVCEINPSVSEIKDFVDDLEVSFVPMSNVSERGAINLSEIRYLKDVKKGFTYFKDGDVLFAKITPCMENGKGAIADKLKNGIGFGSTEFHVLRPSEQLDNRWLYYITASKEFRKTAETSMTGSAGQKRVPKQFFDKYEIPLLALSFQKKAVSALDKAQEIIDKRKAQKETLNELVKSRFIEMFGNPVSNPMGWAKTLCKDVTSKIGSGATPKGGNESYKEEGISLIRSMNVYNDRFEYKDLAHIDDEQAGKLNNVAIEENDILLNITGASVARCCVVPKEIIPARVNQHVSILRCKKGIIPVFMSQQFTNGNYQKLLWNIATSGGATREAITKQQIEDMEVIIPPIELQNQFADFVNQVDKLKFEMEKSLKELENNFNSLMQRAFNGELFN